MLKSMLQDGTRALHNAIDMARTALRVAADPAAAPVRKRYLKTPFEVLGCTVPAVVATARSVRREHPMPETAALKRALAGLWVSPVHDDKLLAIKIASLYVDLFEADDVGVLFLGWLRDCRTWDHVDGLATDVVGRIACRRPCAWQDIERWAGDPHMWVRRAAILSHVPAIRRGGLRHGQLRRTCIALAGEREFFIRKAIGWALRELSLKDAAAAEAILRSLPLPIAPLTLREATRRMPEAGQRRLLATLGRPDRTR